MLGCDPKAQYKMSQVTLESSGCPYPLSYVIQIYSGNRGTKEFTWMKGLTDTSKKRGTANILFYSPSRPWIYIAVRTKHTPSKGNAFGHTPHWAYKNHLHTQTLTHTHTYFYINRVNEGNNFRSLASCPPHHLSIILSPTHPNNFLPTPCSTNRTTQDHLLKLLALNDSYFASQGGGLDFQTLQHMKIRCPISVLQGNIFITEIFSLP